MKELKCPKCGNIFKVDEADYASIVSQVKNAEFEKEIERRLAEMNKRMLAEQNLQAAQSEQSFQAQLSKKDMQLGEKDAAIERMKTEREDQIARVKGERRDRAFEDAVAKHRKPEKERIEPCPCRKRPDYSTTEFHHSAKQRQTSACRDGRAQQGTAERSSKRD